MTSIWVVEARAGLRHALQTILANAGYASYECRSAVEIIQIKQPLPNLILLGDTDEGILRFSTRLKQHPQTRSIPLVLYSTSLSVFNPAFVKATQADAVLSYPYSRAELLEVVGRLLPHNTPTSARM